MSDLYNFELNQNGFKCYLNEISNVNNILYLFDYRKFM